MNEKIFDVNKVFQDRLVSSFGLDLYKDIIQSVMKINVAADADFQRTFNYFYVVRRNAAWRKIYYDYFERIKNEKPTFKEIITYLYEQTGNIEPSFSSKMLASIDPDKPIWDKYILQNLGKELKGKTKQEQLENAIMLYAEIERWYKSFLDTDEAKECIEVFDRLMPDYRWISRTKKIDSVIWGTR